MEPPNVTAAPSVITMPERYVDSLFHLLNSPQASSKEMVMSLLTVRMFGIGAAQSIATLTLLRGIDGLLSNPTLYEDGEEQPTERAISRAKALISEASEAARSSGRPVLASARVVPFNGSIRITWATEAKNLRLVVMASEAQPDYLYREQVTDGRAYGQHLHRPVSPQLLAESLDWLTA